jgi:myo-inositol-1-phosphate synthase
MRGEIRMFDRIRLAIVGVGNNISALVQGVYMYRKMYSNAGENVHLDIPGVSLERIGGFSAGDVDFVAAIDVNSNKVGKDLSIAIFSEPNNYPKLDVELDNLGVPVFPGAILDGIPEHLKDDCKGISPKNESSKNAIVEYLKSSQAEVLLYSLPTNCQQCADFYALCALEAKIAFINCTPDIVGRNPELLSSFEQNSIPLLGDDLASQIGSSILQREILSLLKRRGINIAQSYQINVGGNMDFKNLKVNSHKKLQSKKNALSNDLINTDSVEIIPSAGILKQLKDHKICYMNFEGLGWGGTPISIDLKLVVQDSSNAAGVIIDLVRIAALSKRHNIGGFPLCAAYFLKSPSKNKGRGDISEVSMWEETLASNEKSYS